ncbi:D-alanine--D-alanine ligase family protein [Salmonirosea aquatica]|uniref:D-alanine--D-alanine ligase n=1 Tax=Salmonirosea aquatica TaxID=2654236 RepID=A0A7C9FBC1_9BACT|nr:D-alanine--D-alanine ligase [Cytophagaceae bacterium SJW1-29]
MRIGIFFGGPSREREISFAGGKTAFEHLDKTIFEPVPIFVDSFGRFIKVQTEVLYQKEIRDFFPQATYQKEGYRLYAESYPELATADLPAEVGELLIPQDFKHHFDFAFLAMHGPDCEDGAIQGLLEWYRIPYSGPGLMGSAVGIDKILQNEMIALANGQQKKMGVLTYADWQSRNREEVFEEIKNELGIPIVVKAPHQGSSIGVAIVQKDDFSSFVQAINQCFFQLELSADEWADLTKTDKQNWAQRLANLDEGIGFPVIVEGKEIFHPDALIELLDHSFAQVKNRVTISSSNAEDQVLLETFVRGQEFSCGCLQLDEGTPLALPPTEVIKVVEVFDFNSKYKPGATRKRIPVDTSQENNQKIRQNIATVFGRLGINVCARIDGFLTPEGTVLLHDPNTIPGMSPTSLIFKQMAEIGLNVTQALTYFIRQSIRERIRTGKGTWTLRQQLTALDKKIKAGAERTLPRQGLLVKANDAGYKQAQREFGLICAGGTHEAVPVLEISSGEYFRLPVQLMFKEYVEDVIRECGRERDPVLVQTAREGDSLTAFYAGKVDYSVKRVVSLDGIENIESWTILGD